MPSSVARNDIGFAQIRETEDMNAMFKSYVGGGGGYIQSVF